MDTNRLKELAGIVPDLRAALNEGTEQQTSHLSLNQIIDTLVMYMIKDNFTMDDVEQICDDIKRDFISQTEN